MPSVLASANNSDRSEANYSNEEDYSNSYAEEDEEEDKDGGSEDVNDESLYTEENHEDTEGGSDDGFEENVNNAQDNYEDKEGGFEDELNFSEDSREDSTDEFIREQEALGRDNEFHDKRVAKQNDEKLDKFASSEEDVIHDVRSAIVKLVADIRRRNDTRENQGQPPLNQRKKFNMYLDTIPTAESGDVVVKAFHDKDQLWLFVSSLWDKSEGQQSVMKKFIEFINSSNDDHNHIDLTLEDDEEEEEEEEAYAHDKIEQRVKEEPEEEEEEEEEANLDSFDANDRIYYQETAIEEINRMVEDIRRLRRQPLSSEEMFDVFEQFLERTKVQERGLWFALQSDISLSTFVNAMWQGVHEQQTALTKLRRKLTLNVDGGGGDLQDDMQQHQPVGASIQISSSRPNLTNFTTFGKWLTREISNVSSRQTVIIIDPAFEMFHNYDFPQWVGEQTFSKDLYNLLGVYGQVYKPGQVHRPRIRKLKKNTAQAFWYAHPNTRNAINIVRREIFNEGIYNLFLMHSYCGYQGKQGVGYFYRLVAQTLVAIFDQLNENAELLEDTTIILPLLGFINTPFSSSEVNDEPQTSDEWKAYAKFFLSHLTTHAATLPASCTILVHTPLECRKFFLTNDF